MNLKKIYFIGSSLRNLFSDELRDSHRIYAITAKVVKIKRKPPQKLVLASR